MSKRKRGLFQRDTGNHPEPLGTFFREWTKPGQVKGSWNGQAWWSLKPIPKEEGRANGRAFGAAFLAGGLGLLLSVWALIRYRGAQLDALGKVGVVGVSMVLAGAGILLLRINRRQR